jgi:integration host factor subunit alpha
MALTKSGIVEKISESNGFLKNQALEVTEQLLELIKHTLESGEDVLISGFGKFEVKEKKARKGRNPAAGTSMMLDARKVVTFKCSGKLREKINQKKGKKARVSVAKKSR